MIYRFAAICLAIFVVIFPVLTFFTIQAYYKWQHFFKEIVEKHDLSMNEIEFKEYGTEKEVSMGKIYNLKKNKIKINKHSGLVRVIHGVISVR